MGIHIIVTLIQWNIWGLDNAGKITPDGSKYFYYHLGSVRAIVNQNNQLVSAQDYDCWGYLMQNRTYSSDQSMYKFTGKERDNESTYDYFGARYYDSRIGRWGQVDPFLEKYFDLTPYAYVNNDPLLCIDPSGRDVYIHGGNYEDIIDELNNIRKRTGLTFNIDKYGKLTAEGIPLDMSAEILLNATKDPDIIVNLYVTEDNFVKIDGEKVYFIVGMFNGSYKDTKDKVQTSQYFNIEHARSWEEAGGSNIGVSLIHEIKESYIGGFLFPGESYNRLSFDISHLLASSSDPRKQYFPEIHYDPVNNLVYLKSKNGEKIPLYQK